MFFVVSVISLNTSGCLLGFLEPFMLAISSVFILDKGGRLPHLLPVGILKPG